MDGFVASRLAMSGGSLYALPFGSEPLAYCIPTCPASQPSIACLRVMPQ